MKKILLLLVFSSMTFLIKAQNPHHVTFNSANHAVCMIPQGDFLWYGTESCLIKRNVLTNECQTFTDENSGVSLKWIYALALDEKSNILWIGCDSGVIKYDGTSFTRYSLTWPSLSFGPRQAKDISADTLGNVWIAMGYYGLAKFDGSNFTYYNYSNTTIPNDSYIKVKVTKAGKVWAGTNGQGLINYNGTQWTIYNKTNSLLSFNSIEALALDSSSNLYFSDSYYLYHFDTSMHKLVGLDGYYTLAGLSIDAQQNVWTSYSSLRYDINSNSYWCQEVEKYNTATGDTTISVITTNFEKNIGLYPVSSCFDSYNNYWTGQYWGLQKIDLQTKVSVLYYQGLPPAWTNTCAFVENAFGKLWLGSYLELEGWSGLGSFDGKNWETYIKYNSSLKSDGIIGMDKDDQGNLWLAVKYLYDGSGSQDTNFLYKYDGQNFSLIYKFPDYTYVNSLLVDTFNNVWTSDDRKIRKYNGNSWVVYDSLSFPAFQIGYNGFIFKSIKKDHNNNIWGIAVTNSFTNITSKVIKYDGINWTQYLLPDSCNAESFTIDNSNKLWISTDHGLYKFDGTNWTNFTTANSGISSDRVNCSVMDNNGKLYVASSSLSSGGTMNVFNDTTWTNFTALPYSSNSFNTLNFHLFCDSHNNIYFCYYGFVYVYNESRQGVTFNSLYKDQVSEGKIYYDSDLDGMYDSTEVGLANQKVMLLPDSISCWSNATGDYSINADTLAHSIIFIPKTNWNQTSAFSGYNIHYNSPECCYNFGTIPSVLQDDLSINVTNGAPVRCGFTIPYHLNYKNTGTTICDGTVSLSHDQGFQFMSSSQAVNNVVGNTSVWNFTNLYPDEERHIVIYLQAPLTASGQLCNYAEISRKSGIQFIVEEGDSICSTLTCSADPNDKAVEPEGITGEHFTLKTAQFEYTIRFQNLGTDTAFTVVIKDSLSNLLDWNSLDVTGYSSPVMTSIDKNGLATFRFENALLPNDDVNEPASHGFVKYKINPKQNLADGSQVYNIADIYFDYNYPIRTNTVFNTLVTSINVGFAEVSTSTPNESVIPQPVKDKADIVFPLNAKGNYLLTLYDGLGNVTSSETRYFSNSIYGKFEINLGNSPAGIYFFRISNPEKLCEISGKILKQ